MNEPEKVCPVIFRTNGSTLQTLAFEHPNAGKQFVKGTIQAGEAPAHAALRELTEESGLNIGTPMSFYGQFPIGPNFQIWRFFYAVVPNLPDRWQHWTGDGGGHEFAFFWHPLGLMLNDAWHPLFHEVFVHIREIAIKL